MSAFDSRDSAHSITSQLIFGLLFGNVVAILAAIGFHPYTGPIGLDDQSALVLLVGVLSLIASGLLFMAAAIRRRTTGWWVVAVSMNAAQVGRLIPAVVAIPGWTESGDLVGVFWAFLYLPVLAVLSAVGLVMTLREMRKGRRRRLSHAS